MEWVNGNLNVMQGNGAIQVFIQTAAFRKTLHKGHSVHDAHPDWAKPTQPECKKVSWLAGRVP